MKIQNLGGEWDYRIGKGKFSKRQVPFSALAVGHSECERYFDLDHKAERTELCFDGITYAATVTLNGKVLGNMLPYCEYTFDVTDIVRERDNFLHVDIEDTQLAFGPVAGWENFGGIIRDVKLVYGNREKISDAFFSCKLSEDYRNAEVKIELEGEELGGCLWQIDIKDEKGSILSDSVSCESKVYSAIVNDVELWSTESPKLYDLQIKVVKNGEIRDILEKRIGFREIKCDDKKFYLNGKPIFLRGVCKHEMVGDSGHTVKYSDVHRDMKIIKELGCNFVRLVHYPHGTAVLDIADEMGLLVSEEPGLWWSDTANEEIAAGSIEVLRRTIKRDRSRACVAFWLCFNECKFTEKFLIDSAAACKQTDPTRLVSGANCMSDEETLKYFDICGFDFYTMHPYAETFEKANHSAHTLLGKPLVFTEWGGYYVYDNPRLMREFIHRMRGLYDNASEKAALAGAFLWAFAETNDYNRQMPAVKDGRLLEGLVDYNRNPRRCFDVFREAFSEDLLANAPFSLDSVGTLPVGAKPLEYRKGAVSYAELYEKIWNKPKPAFLEEQRPRIIKVGPVCENLGKIPVFSEPLALGEDKISFGGAHLSKLIILGCVSASEGYPLSREYGECAALVKINFRDGRCAEHPIRNGVELTTVYTTHRSSRIDPVAERAERFAEFSYDKSFEAYVINRLDIDLGAEEDVESVELVRANEKYDILTYGIYFI